MPPHRQLARSPAAGARQLGGRRLRQGQSTAATCSSTASSSGSRDRPAARRSSGAPTTNCSARAGGRASATTTCEVMHAQRSITSRKPRRLRRTGSRRSSRTSSRCSTPTASPTRSAASRPTSPIASAARMRSRPRRSRCRARRGDAVRQLRRYLAAILGVDGAFIAVDADQPGQLRMLAFHSTAGRCRTSSTDLAGTPCETVVGHEFRLSLGAACSSFPLGRRSRRWASTATPGTRSPTRPAAPLGLIAAVARKPLRDPALVEATLRDLRGAGQRRARARARASSGAARVGGQLPGRSSRPRKMRSSCTTGTPARSSTSTRGLRGSTATPATSCSGCGIGDLSSSEPPYTEAEAQRGSSRRSARRDGRASNGVAATRTAACIGTRCG